MASSQRQKDDDPAYESVPAYRDASLSDADSILDERPYPKPKRSRRRHNLVAVWLAVLCVLSVYTLLATYVTSNWWGRERIHGAGVVESALESLMNAVYQLTDQQHL